MLQLARVVVEALEADVALVGVLAQVSLEVALQVPLAAEGLLGAGRTDQFLLHFLQICHKFFL